MGRIYTLVKREEDEGFFTERSYGDFVYLKTARVPDFLVQLLIIEPTDRISRGDVQFRAWTPAEEYAGREEKQVVVFQHRLNFLLVSLAGKQ